MPTEAVDTMRPQSAVLATSITYWQEPASTGKEPVRVPSISVDRLSDIEERSNIPTSVRARPAMAKRMPMHRDTFWHVLLQAMVSAGPGDHGQSRATGYTQPRARGWTPSDELPFAENPRQAMRGNDISVLKEVLGQEALHSTT